MTFKLAAGFVSLIILSACTKSNVTLPSDTTTTTPTTTTTATIPTTTTTTTKICGTKALLKFDVACRLDAHNGGHFHCGTSSYSTDSDDGVNANSGKRIDSKFWYSPEISTDSKLKVRFTPKSSFLTKDGNGKDLTSSQRAYKALKVLIRLKGKDAGYNTDLIKIGAHSEIIDLSTDLETGSSSYRVEVGEPETDYECYLYNTCSMNPYGSGCTRPVWNWQGTLNNKSCVKSNVGIDVSGYSASCPSAPLWDGQGRHSVTGCETCNCVDNGLDEVGATFAGTLEVETNNTVCL